MTRPIRQRCVAALVATALMAGACSGSSGEPEPALVGLDAMDAPRSLAPTLFAPGDLPDRYGDLDRVLNQFVSVVGVSILATPTVPAEDIVEVAAVIAEFLDNDEDGVPDDIRVMDALARSNTTVVMASTASEIQSTGFFEAITEIPDIDRASLTTLYADEMDANSIDLVVARVHALLFENGWGRVHDEIAFADDSPLARAMDTARNGRFPSPPADGYADAAWFTDRQGECRYLCQLTRYFTWAHLSLLGANSARCDEIAVVWELCSADLVRERDTAVTALLELRSVSLPTLLPDGFYAPDI